MTVLPLPVSPAPAPAAPRGGSAGRSGGGG
ncbi:MAG: hypothetical protein JWM15_3088, partial [Cryptosporangiaceae bacterium]|nr:hypothetical protein [Cryptosporangiaceae bacterium]